MYQVTTFHLGPDGRRASASSESSDRGELSAEELVVLLDAFTEIDPVDNEDLDPHILVTGRSTKLIIRTSRDRLQVYRSEELVVLLDAFTEIDPVDNEDLDPHILVTGRSTKLIIRTSRDRLQVYDGRDHAAPAVEMTAAGIVERLDQASESVSPLPQDEAGQPPPTAPHRGIAFAMLVVGLALNGYILYSVFYVESVNKKPDVKLVTDAGEVKARQATLAGTFATGNRTGDRIIEVGAGGDVRFYEI